MTAPAIEAPAPAWASRIPAALCKGAESGFAAGCRFVELALENGWVHILEHALFLSGALLFWWPAVALDPAPWRMSHPARIGYLFTQMTQNTFLAVVILNATSILYPHYATLVRPWGMAALEDGRCVAVDAIAGRSLGPYEIISTLGAGGMGRVYQVRNVITDRVEAMKVLLPEISGQEEVAARFLREIKVLAALNHPHIARLHTAHVRQ